MEVHIRDGGDGVQCWNGEAITAYARSRAARQAQLTSANPDLIPAPGRVTCHGCTALEYGQGFGCTAGLTQTLYQVRGESTPGSPAVASLSIIPGFLGRIDADASSPAPQPSSIL